MAETAPHSAAFRHNAQAALKDGTFEEVLSALVMKLQERGVFDEDAAEEARKNYSPLAGAFLRPRDQEARDRAWGDISARIFQLGSLLPPEDSDGAFLADRVQVKALLDRRADLWAQKALAEMREKRAAGPSHVDERDEDEEGDIGAGPFEGDIFESLGKNPDFFWGLYSGGVPPPEGASSGPSQRGDAPRPDAPDSSGGPTADADIDKRAGERRFFEDALLGSPFHGDVAVLQAIDTEVTMKLLWAVRQNPVNDVLWALTLKAVETGVANPPPEKETVNLIVALSMACSYLADHDDKSIRRNAVDTLRSQLVRLVGLLPRDVWASDFLDHREDVLKLIGDRALAGE